jgi:hypothetical protein
MNGSATSRKNDWNNIKMSHLKKWADTFCARKAQENSPTDRPISAPDRLTKRFREYMLGWFAEHPEAWNSMYDPEAEQLPSDFEEWTEFLDDCYEFD